MKVAELLANAQRAIQTACQSSKQEAHLLLQPLLKVNRAWLIAHADDQVSAEVQTAFDALVKRRLNGEPIAYILGEREFYGLNFKVTPDTLIPRPDTETLVDAALTKITTNQPSHILDLGTGTGAVALAIAKNRPQSHVTAIDASEDALKIAQENAEKLNIQNATFLLSHWLDALQRKTFDVIVSNPPYIEDNDPHLRQGDLRFEPLSALASGLDGLDDIRQIVQQAPAHLNTNGWLMLEHGYNQAGLVAALLKRVGFTEINHTLDLAGIQRVTLGRIT